MYLAWILVKTSVELGAAGGTAGTGIGALAGLVTLVVIFFTSRKGRMELLLKIRKITEWKQAEKLHQTFLKLLFLLLLVQLFSL